MMPRYSISTYWGPRQESPETLARRYLAMLDSLSKIEPVFGNWFFAGDEKATPLKGLSFADVTNLIAEGVSRADDGDPIPRSGYWMGAITALKRIPTLIRVTANAGSISVANYLINSVSLDTAPLSKENASFIDVRVFKAAVLAIASAWDATWCAASHWGIPEERELRLHRPHFGLAWMTYISPRFAPMITPPRTAICERVPGGGLLMIATEERFSADNPAHLAVARDIEAALEPVNALPWPPDAKPQST